jgi:hypothetical protein
MKKICTLALILSLLIIISCKNDNEVKINETDYLVFGHFYGECMGETCVETFMLTDEKLYEDEKDNYFGTDQFDFRELGQDKFELVKDLIDDFPAELLDDTNDVFGCPDCADQGGLLVILAQNGNVKSWRIDQAKSAVPQYLNDFMDSINVKISLLNK